MSWARGFFRLWAVLTALYVSALTVGYAPTIHDAFSVYVFERYAPEPCGDPAVIDAVKAFQAEGVVNASNFLERCAPKQTIRLRIIELGTGEIGPIPKSAETSTDLLGTDTPQQSKASFFLRQQGALQTAVALRNEKLRVQRKDAVKNMQKFLFVAIFPPLVLLLSGAGLAWALRGFFPSRR